MEYTIHKLARMSGVSVRTLRYYDEIDLLKPQRIASNGYRIYGSAQAEKLQQILFYRELDMPLEAIRAIVNSPQFDREKAFLSHLEALQQKKQHIDTLIQTVHRTLESIQGGTEMKDNQRFEGFKQKIIAENEKAYGTETREKYGEESVAASNAKLAGMTQTEWQHQQELSDQIHAKLKAAMQSGDPSCEEAQIACDLHRQWLCMFWKEGMYTKQAHMGLGEMYVADERFTAYYETHVGPGAASFFRDALKVYTQTQE